MHSKTLAITLSLTLLFAFSVNAQQTLPKTQNKEDVETELDRQANNLNIIPIEERVKIMRNNTKAIDRKLKNLRKGEIKDLIKNINQIEKRSARLEGREAEIEEVNPSDKVAVRKLLQKDFTVEEYPLFK